MIGSAPRATSHEFVRHFLIIGVLGGYTTFSSFSLQTLELFRSGNTVAGLANVVGSVVLCLAGVWAGHAIGRTLGI